jgi:hypothetical protein
VGLVEHFGGIVITEARKRREDGFEFGTVAANDGELGAAVFEDGLDDVGEEGFGEFIQNSVRWRRVLDFSARKVGPKL